MGGGEWVASFLEWGGVGVSVGLVGGGRCGTECIYDLTILALAILALAILSIFYLAYLAIIAVYLEKTKAYNKATM